MTNKRVALRLYRESDRRALGELFADPDVMQLVGDRRPLPFEEGARFIDRIFEKYRDDPSFYVRAVEAGGAYAGHAELKCRKGRSEYELIYILNRANWGRGIGGSVADLLLEEARRRRLPFVIATVYPENAASVAILRRRGFVLDEALSAELDTTAFKLLLA